MFARIKLFLTKLRFPHFSAATLKWIALLSMTADHISVICRPIAGFREVGNLAFPLFAFLLTEGFFHTKNRRTYKIRLFLATVVSEIPYDLAFSGHLIDIYHQNVCLTLLMAFIAMELLEQYGTGIWEKIVILSVFCMAAEAMRADGETWGMLLILLFYFCEKSQIDQKQLMKVAAATVISAVAWQVPLWVIVLMAICLLIYDRSKGRRWYRDIFYAYYPTHLIILYLLSRIL